MILSEQHIIKKSDKRFKELNNNLLLSKNLYNAGLYAIRQEFFKNKKYLNYNAINRIFVKNKNVDYYALPSKVSQQTLKLLDQNFKSFFALVKKTDFAAKIPKYLKKDGSYPLIYTNQAISFQKKGFVKLSKTTCFIKTQQQNIQQVRVVKKLNHIVVEVLYKKSEKELKPTNERYCSVDLGLNNLATVGSNVIKPIIINGKPLKSINQYYNKKKSKLKINQRKKIRTLTTKRNNKIKDQLHKASRYLVNHLVSNQINTLIIGHNKEWKQDINIGKRNNQNFVGIPHSTFINMLLYKCKMEGINTIVREESYTSKCSFLDNEEVKKHDTYLGRRVKRGLFKSSKDQIINADLNGALNIMKKVVGEFKYPIEVCSAPTVFTVK